MASGRGVFVRSLVVALLAAEPLPATPPAIPARLLATMNQPPRGSDGVLQWLKAHGDEVSRGLAELSNYDASRQPLWAYAKVKRRSWRDRRKVVPGVTKGFVADVPVIEPEFNWKASWGRVVVGYRRRVKPLESIRRETVVEGTARTVRTTSQVDSVEGVRIVGVNDPRQLGDQPVCAKTIELLVDDRGDIYY
ncbi:MAG: hypothetical protein Q8R78_03855 [Candidatus Omnitrophota bacterium]|nr:hypothetical protein [Candidatus Omnitrophota bacterium]